ncbi:hypothetical protein BZA05DRAFT_398606 [Tricharina praecox]|uniref:uncharacterized protein n=1 Tax=Tricharina praecox TaxID=43433 RepID=UPI002220B0E6|nr:uncharacterized protein BZA05DRAFT_398606 [Tricharina praecox]KAI5851999.1 hypothetical protein BZA05DRAFT_398606 [Tricharina praecox]
MDGNTIIAEMNHEHIAHGGYGENGSAWVPLNRAPGTSMGSVAFGVVHYPECQHRAVDSRELGMLRYRCPGEGHRQHYTRYNDELGPPSGAGYQSNHGPFPGAAVDVSYYGGQYPVRHDTRYQLAPDEHNANVVAVEYSAPAEARSPQNTGRRDVPRCPYCHEPVVQLRRHIMTVHPQTLPTEPQKYFCGVKGCPRTKSFNRKDNRDQHLRTVHKIEPLVRE